MGSSFILGTFKHINWPVYGKVLKSTDLVVKFNVVVDGENHSIEHIIKLKHTETPNNGNANKDRDIVEIEGSTLKQSFTVDDRTFELKIDGFKNSEYGTPVSKVYTWENKVNEFDLYATISAVNDMPSLEGTVGENFHVGADSIDSPKVKWGNIEPNSNGDYIIANEMGTFIGKADGSYTFEMSRSGRDSMEKGQTKDIVFDYSVTDADGDTASASVNISTWCS